MLPLPPDSISNAHCQSPLLIRDDAKRYSYAKQRDRGTQANPTEQNVHMQAQLHPVAVSISICVAGEQWPMGCLAQKGPEDKAKMLHPPTSKCNIRTASDMRRNKKPSRSSELKN